MGRCVMIIGVAVCSLTTIACARPTGHKAEPARSEAKPIVVLDAGGHTGVITGVLFTPDGRELITVSTDKTIRTWDVARGLPLRVIRPPIGPGPEGKLYAVALARDGRTLAVGGFGSEGKGAPIFLIRLADGQIEQVLKEHSDAITSLAFSNDGTRLASGCMDKTARIWDVASGRVLHELIGHGGRVRSVAWSPDDRFLATASNDRTARIWSADAGISKVVLPEHEAEIPCVAWSPDGLAIATIDNKQIRLWSPEGTPGTVFPGMGRPLSSLAFTPDSGRLLLTPGTGGAKVCALLDLKTGRSSPRFYDHTNTVTSGALSPDGSLAATADYSGVAYLWRTSDGASLHRLTGRGDEIFGAAWMPDGSGVAWGASNRDKAVNAEHPLERVFHLADLALDGPPTGEVERARPALGSLDLEGDGDTSVVVKRAGVKVATIKMADSLERVRCFTLLSDERAAVGTEYGLHLFEAGTGRLLRTFRGHTGVVWAVAPSPDRHYLVSGSGDRTLRIWDPDRDEPLLSLFPAGNDWIAWTPEGYYACSAGGERLMGWHVNHEPEKMASYYPASDLHERFYRPDVIGRLLETGSVKRALEVLKDRSPSATVDESLPPLVVITAPDRDGVVLGDQEVEVRAVATGQSSNPVMALRLLVDGRPYPGQSGSKGIEPGRVRSGDVRESWSVRLSPGSHRIAALAEGPASAHLSDEVEVTVRAPRSKKPRLFALAIGISKYSGPPSLDYAAKDAGDLERTLKQHAGTLFASVESKLVTDANATRNGIIDSLVWLRERAGEDDVTIVFYSGHGAVDRDGTFHLVPVDGDLSHLATTAVPGGQFRDLLRGMKGRVVVLLDACHAGAAEGAGPGAGGVLPVVDAGVEDGRKGATAVPTDDLARTLAGHDYGVTVMSSSAGSEASREAPELEQGYFTAALIEALGGRADYNRDGLVYLTELDAYISDRVKELTHDRQHPVTAKPRTVLPFALAQPQP